MKNKIYLRQNLLPYRINAFLLAMLLLLSCRKDDDAPPTEVHDLKAMKNWYLESSHSPDNENFLASFVPQWEKSSVSKHDGITVYEIECTNPKKIVTALRSDVRTDKQKEYATADMSVRLLLFAGRNGTKKAAFMFINGSGNKLVRYKKTDGFTGMATFYNPDGSFANGYQYRYGKIDKNINPAPQQTSENSKVANANNCVVSTWDVYQETCIIVGGIIPSKNASGKGTAGTKVCSWTYMGSFETIRCDGNGGDDGSGGGYVPGGSGGGGGGSSGPSITQSDLDNAVVIADGKPNIANIKKYTDCFADGKQVQTYTLTIYVDQPVPGGNDQWIVLAPNHQLTDPSERGIMIKTQNADIDVGHSFVCFEKNNTDGSNVRQTLGFYPNKNGSGPNAKGAIKDNSGSPYDVSYKITVTEEQFYNALNRMAFDFINSEYILTNSGSKPEYNCTDATIKWMNAAGANLSGAPRGFFKNTPGDFGQALRSKPGANTSGGSGPAGKGACN